MAKKNLLYREFGLLLGSERRRKGLSQAQFGTLAGLSRTSVTNIECGRQPIQLHQLYLFASILRIDISKLLPKESQLVEAPVLASQTASDKEARYIADAMKVITRLKTSSIEDDHGG